MSEYIKSTLAILPQKIHSLHSFSSYRPNVPNIHFPTTNFQGKNNLPTRNPRAFITFAILLLLLFWKDVIRDVCSHVATRRLPVSVVEVSPIRNNTLGVSLPEDCCTTTPMANSKSSFKIYLSFPCQNEVTEEHPSSLRQMRQISHSPWLMPYETGKYPNRIGLRYVTSMLSRFPHC